MSVDEVSQGPASKRRKQEKANTAPAEFWNARFEESGTEYLLCSSCRSLLIRPACDPTTQDGMSSINIFQSLSRASSAAMNGCIICKLVLAVQTTINQHTASVDRLDGFKLALYWSGKLSRFCRIDVAPVDHMDRNLSSHPYLNAINLISEDEHEDKVINYTSPLHTGSNLCRSIAIQWLVNCITHHAKCREQHTTADWLPTRLIDVGFSAEPQQPRLILTSELNGSNNSYVTLSHRWASAHVVKLESSNIDSFRQCLPLESLSSTFLDAISVTRALGVRYLWIDSLCIIQNSLADWQAESTEMGSIYQNCVCNIAATASSDYGGGPFQERNTHWVTPNRVRVQYEGHDKIYSAILDDLWGKWISRSSLNRRWWVLQERLLSSRTLHFASQLFWECRTLQACETYPEGMPIDNKCYTELDGTELPISLKNWHEEFEGKEFWIDIVQTYGRCSITMPEDRLIAIAGVAKSLQPLR